MNRIFKVLNEKLYLEIYYQIFEIRFISFTCTKINIFNRININKSQCWDRVFHGMRNKSIRLRLQRKFDFHLARTLINSSFIKVIRHFTWTLHMTLPRRPIVSHGISRLLCRGWGLLLFYCCRCSLSASCLAEHLRVPVLQK